MFHGGCFAYVLSNNRCSGSKGGEGLVVEEISTGVNGIILSLGPF